MPLSELACRKATCPPEQARVRLSDEKGLYLEVTAKGGRYWRWKYRFMGKEKLLALGVYPDVSLAKAREDVADARKVLAGGVDPGQAKRDSKQQRKADHANTFEAVARQWWEHWRQGKSERHADYAMRRLVADVFPAIGARPVRDVTARDLKDLSLAVQKRGALDMAHRVLQMSGAVLRYAVAHDLAERNPAADIRPADILRTRRKVNYARLDEKELGELLRRIDAYQGGPYTRLAMKLMCLTFVRTSELIGARWQDFDLKVAQWRIPGRVEDAQGRKLYGMKKDTAHVVALAPQAVEVLLTLQTLSGGRALLFPGERDHARPMSNNTILKALERMGYKGLMTGHGFRGMASTILHEHGFAHHAIEAQLAHQERDEVSAAYNHALYLPERKAMLFWWADYLDKARKGADVIELQARSA